MSESSAGNPIRDKEWDRKYFNLILELEEKNASRYEQQASNLLIEKSLETLVNGISLTYKLDRIGCSSFIQEDKNSQKVGHGWGGVSQRNAKLCLTFLQNQKLTS